MKSALFSPKSLLNSNSYLARLWGNAQTAMRSASVRSPLRTTLHLGEVVTGWSRKTLVTDKFVSVSHTTRT